MMGETTSGERAERDAAAYDERRVWEVSNAWNARVPHVVEAPNTLAAEAEVERLIGERAAGGRGVDTGPRRRIVLATNVAETALKIAREREEPGRVEFVKHDASKPIEGRFDLIVGRAVLHHIDFRDFLVTAYERNLADGGRLLFMEPCAHPMTVAFHKLVRSAHTDDEFPLLPRDVRWLRATFPQARVEPVNLLSFPVGVVSGWVFSSPDNAVMRATDRIDSALARRPRLQAYGRQGIVVVDKPRG